MSKRAKELAFEIWDLSTESGEWPEYKAIVAALIDAELRKERERCAERFRAVACPLVEARKENNWVVVSPSCAECARILSYESEVKYCTEVAAILSEEE